MAAAPIREESAAATWGQRAGQPAEQFFTPLRSRWQSGMWDLGFPGLRWPQRPDEDLVSDCRQSDIQPSSRKAHPRLSASDSCRLAPRMRCLRCIL